MDKQINLLCEIFIFICLEDTNCVKVILYAKKLVLAMESK